GDKSCGGKTGAAVSVIVLCPVEDVTTVMALSCSAEASGANASPMATTIAETTAIFRFIPTSRLDLLLRRPIAPELLPVSATLQELCHRAATRRTARHAASVARHAPSRPCPARACARCTGRARRCLRRGRAWLPTRP